MPHEARQKSPLINTKGKQAIVAVTLALLLIITLIPFAATILVSQKTNAEIYTSFWAPPKQLHPEYFVDAFKPLWPYILNSLMVGLGAVSGVLVLSSLSGYVFARIPFPGKSLLYSLLLVLMMVPAILTLIPLFKWIQGMPFVGGNDIWGQGGSGFLNSWFALWFPYWSGGQIFGILLCRTHFESMPETLFEAARIDGASEFTIYRNIAIPLSLPIIATLAIMQFVGVYNDYIWPLVTISSGDKQVFAVGITQFAAEAQLDMAPQMAGYIIGSLPMVLVFIFGSKYYVEGLASGAVKA